MLTVVGNRRLGNGSKGPGQQRTGRGIDHWSLSSSGLNRLSRGLGQHFGPGPQSGLHRASMVVHCPPHRGCAGAGVRPTDWYALCGVCEIDDHHLGPARIKLDAGGCHSGAAEASAYQSHGSKSTAELTSVGGYCASSPRTETAALPFSPTNPQTARLTR